MQYDYLCQSCNTIWEESQTMENRDIPTILPCPHCDDAGMVKRGWFTAPRISYDGAKTILQRAGSGWNDVLTKIKKGSARDNTIETR